MQTFKPYTTAVTAPSALQDRLPEGHLALFISDVVDHRLDLAPILAAYETGDGRDQPPYHSTLLVKRLMYAYCTGTVSSRRGPVRPGPRPLPARRLGEAGRRCSRRYEGPRQHLEALMLKWLEPVA